MIGRQRDGGAWPRIRPPSHIAGVVINGRRRSVGMARDGLISAMARSNHSSGPPLRHRSVVSAPSKLAGIISWASVPSGTGMRVRDAICPSTPSKGSSSRRSNGRTARGIPDNGALSPCPICRNSYTAAASPTRMKPPVTATLPAISSAAPNQVSRMGIPSPSPNTPAATVMKLSNANRKTMA
jgi:hypothetical protein